MHKDVVKISPTQYSYCVRVADSQRFHDFLARELETRVEHEKKAAAALKWAVTEMEQRYRKLASVGVRNLAQFNDLLEKEPVWVSLFLMG